MAFEADRTSGMIGCEIRKTNAKLARPKIRFFYIIRLLCPWKLLTAKIGVRQSV